MNRIELYKSWWANGGAGLTMSLVLAILIWAADNAVPIFGVASAGLATTVIGLLVTQLTQINRGEKPVVIPPGEPAPATGALAPADAVFPSTGGPPLPYTDVLTGKEYPSYGAYRDRFLYDPASLPPEA